MARLGRYFVADQPLHVIQRGNNHQAIFFEDENYLRYRGWLAEAAAEYGCAIHAYVLMTNHVHLLATPEKKESLPRLMQSLGRRYVRYVNGEKGRTGTLWEGATARPPSTATNTFLAVGAISNSIPSVRVWWTIRAIILGQAIRLTPRASPTRLSATISCFASWAAALPSGRKPIAPCSAVISTRRSSTSCAPLPPGRPANAKRDKRQLNLL